MTQLINPTILIVGLGKMGGALVNGWLAQDVDSNKIHVVEPNPIQVMGLNCKTLNVYQGPREIRRRGEGREGPRDCPAVF